MTDPTPEPAPAPTPAPTVVQFIADDRIVSTEQAQAQAQAAVVAQMQRTADLLSQPTPVAETSPKEVYFRALLCQIPETGPFDDERADGIARKIVRLYRDFE